MAGDSGTGLGIIWEAEAPGPVPRWSVLIARGVAPFLREPVSAAVLTEVELRAGEEGRDRGTKDVLLRRSIEPMRERIDRGLRGVGGSPALVEFDMMGEAT